MNAKIHFIIILLITLISNNSFSQGSGWVEIMEVQDSAIFNEVQFVSQNIGYIGSSNGKLLKSTNAGLNWSTYVYNPPVNITSIYFLDSQTGYMGTNNGVLLKTTNGGLSIDSIKMPGLRDILSSVCFPSRDTGYVTGLYGGLYKSFNGGINWSSMQAPFTTYFSYKDLFCVNNNVVFISGVRYDQSFYQLFRTLNGGANWDDVHIISNGSGYGINFTNANTGYIICESYSAPVYISYVFKTTNGGNNWLLSLEDSVSRYRSVFFLDQYTGFVVGIGNSSFAKTTNSGETWSVYESSLFYGLQSVYFINANTGVAAGLYRIIRTTNGGEPIGIKPISSEIPETFSLYQNYPNPFNPLTRIKYDIPPSKGARGMITKLIIYDVLGKEVQTLFNEQLSPGTYEVSFDGSNFSSGVYYYQLTISNEQSALIYSETRKMVLVK